MHFLYENENENNESNENNENENNENNENNYTSVKEDGPGHDSQHASTYKYTPESGYGPESAFGRWGLSPDRHEPSGQGQHETTPAWHESGQYGTASDRRGISKVLVSRGVLGSLTL